MHRLPSLASITDWTEEREHSSAAGSQVGHRLLVLAGQARVKAVCVIGFGWRTSIIGANVSPSGEPFVVEFLDLETPPVSNSPMPKQQDIRNLVDQFVSDVSARVHQQALETVRAALGAGAAPARRGPGRPRKAGRRGPGRPRKTAARRGPGRPRKAAGRIRRSSADLEQTAAKVLAYVRANAGQRLEEIGKGLRMATAGLKRPIQTLLAAGSLRTEGQKRGTRYFAGGRGKAKAGRKVAHKAGKRGKAKAKRAARRAPARAKRAVKARRKLSPEQRAALLERLAKARAARRAAG